MDFDFTEEQELLRETARSFVAANCPPEVAKEWDETYTAPTKLFDAWRDMDWFALPYPEADGGAGGTAMELAILSEELGRASFDIAMCYISSVNAGLSLHKWASPEQRAAIFPDVLTGRRRFALSISEPEAGSDVASLETYAEDRGDHFVINGEKMWCTGAGLPNTSILMYVRTNRDVPRREGISVLLVDPATPGVELRQMPTLARHTLGTFSVALTDVVVPKENLVGPQDGGWKVLLSGLDLERVLISGAYVGAAQSTIDEAVRYGMQRVQSGQPVATYQALSHPLADVQTNVDAARLLVYRAAWLVAQGRPSLREGSMAKLLGSETYVDAARLGMQVWGGYGFSTESIMSFRYRESIVATISGGTSQIQRNVIAGSMGIRAPRK